MTSTALKIPAPRPGGRRRQPDRSAGSRDRLFAAAAAEFAARGFAGANVDRIARAARLNKAMIYYHFTSKAALYREILRDMFEAVARRVSETARSSADPADKIRAFVEAIAVEAEARPHFPPIWFREIAEGGAHLDAATVAHIATVVKTLGAIVKDRESRRTGSALSTRCSSMPASSGRSCCISRAPGFASGSNAAACRGAGFDRDEVVAHVQRVALNTLEGQPS